MPFQGSMGMYIFMQYKAAHLQLFKKFSSCIGTWTPEDPQLRVRKTEAHITWHIIQVGGHTSTYIGEV